MFDLPDGIILLNKPQGLSSNIALQKVKRLFKANKAGHTGSLDPLATGMLPICLGQATKFTQYLLGADKTYQVEAQLGVTTLTGDKEGEIRQCKTVPSFNQNQIRRCLAAFKGKILQVPPMYSALKYHGQPLYYYARQGIQLDIAARFVYIHRLDLLNYHADRLCLSVTCSKGTYIRSLVEDIGQLLGCGAHVHRLHRSHVGNFRPEQMVNLDYLTKLEKPEKLLLPLDYALQDFPCLCLNEEERVSLQQGKIIKNSFLHRGLVRLVTQDGNFIGLGIGDENIKVKRLLSLS